MIPIVRGPEPQALADVRASKLPVLQALVASGGRPKSEDIKGYGHEAVRRALWEMQHKKCCYCEKDIENTREDVEHHRPKAEANREPGSPLKDGYWWLAFTWENLYYACPQCNQAPYKGVQFPLDMGSVPLSAGDEPPGFELPLLIDPVLESGISHIEFICQKRAGKAVWVPTPRHNSPKGDWTIRVCGLDRDALLGQYSDHVRDRVFPVVNAVRAAVLGGDPALVYQEVERGRRKLLQPRQRFVGLSHDALRILFPDRKLAVFRLAWPSLV